MDVKSLIEEVTRIPILTKTEVRGSATFSRNPAVP